MVGFANTGSVTIPKPALPVGDQITTLVERFFSDRANLGRLSPKSIRVMRHDLLGALSPGFSERQAGFLPWLNRQGVADINLTTIRHISGYSNYLVQNRGISQASHIRILSTLRSFLKWAYRMDYLCHDLAEKLELPRRRKLLTTSPLSEEQVVNLRRRMGMGGTSLPTTPIATLKRRAVLALLCSGLRVGEIAGLRLDGLVDGHNGATMVKVNGKTGDRLVPIAGADTAILKAFADAVKAKSATTGSPYLFRGSDGASVTVRALERLVKRMVGLAGFCACPRTFGCIR